MQSAQVQISTFDFSESGIFCRRSRDNNDVQSVLYRLQVQTVAFPQKPGNMMPHHAVSHFFGNGDSYSGIRPVIGRDIHDQEPVGSGIPPVVNRLEILVFFNGIKILHGKKKGHNLSGKKIAAYTITKICQADNLALPFALLAARTFLPPAVAILARKP